MASLMDSVMQTSSVAPQAIAFTSSAAASTAVSNSAQPFTIVRLTSTTDCFWKASTAGTDATTENGEFLPAGIVEYKKLNGGDIISVIQSASAGTLYITEQA